MDDTKPTTDWDEMASNLQRIVDSGKNWDKSRKSNKRQAKLRKSKRSMASQSRKRNR